MKTKCKHVKILMTENQSSGYELKQAGNQQENKRTRERQHSPQTVRWKRAGESSDLFKKALRNMINIHIK